ncbi:MAG TPA: hypothetical protein VGO80_19495 [Solirubrobacteraceae bacterium]|jgi:hypothetical protein|nr:hypothetical protein [Solirubrobacteraceae bacterium]
MSEDLFLQLLLKHSATRLRELGAEADEKIRQGQLERAYIDRALEAKGATAPQQARAAERPRSATPKLGGTREPIKQVMATDSGRIWMPAEVTAQLAERFGIDVAVNSVRATMKRLLAEGDLARPAEGANGFRLASTNGSHPESRAEATNSGPGGSERQGALAPTDGLG